MLHKANALERSLNERHDFHVDSNMFIRKGIQENCLYILWTGHVDMFIH